MFFYIYIKLICPILSNTEVEEYYVWYDPFSADVCKEVISNRFQCLSLSTYKIWNFLYLLEVYNLIRHIFFMFMIFKGMMFFIPN